MISHLNYQLIYLSMWQTGYKSILVTVYCHIIHDKLGVTHCFKELEIFLPVLWLASQNCFKSRKSEMYIFNGI